MRETGKLARGPLETWFVHVVVLDWECGAPIVLPYPSLFQDWATTEPHSHPLTGHSRLGLRH